MLFPRVLRTVGLPQCTSPVICSTIPIVSKYASTSAIHGQTRPDPKTDATDPPAQKAGDSEMIRKEDPSEGMVRHRPNFDSPVDHGTSMFSPIPKRVIDGSEDTNFVSASVLSGAPVELQGRTVRIYRPTKTATQSGEWHGHHWQMDWDVLGKGHRWENPLMGWQSSGDFMQGTHMNFRTKEDAIRFAEKQGYEYFVQEPTERKFLPKAYANNFLWSDKKLKHIRTK